MDQPKMERLLRLIMMLSGNLNYTIEDIADSLDMSVRTVYRYLDTFKEAGFAVCKVSGNIFRLATVKKPVADLSKLVHFSEEEAFIVNGLIESLDNTNALKTELKQKLAAVYDVTSIGSYTVDKACAANFEAISSAVREKRCVSLKAYESVHSGARKDYIVEPFEFTQNYIYFWAYDTAEGVNKRFKLARAGRAEMLDKGWEHEEEHRKMPVDAFRAHGLEKHHVRLKLDMASRSLMTEDYPLSAKDIRESEDGGWIYEGDVCNFEGIGRFVLGIADHIEILESEEFKEYIRNYRDKVLCRI